MSGPGPLTVAATWKVKPGKESEFEEWHRGISAAATVFPGHLGVSVMRPGNSSGEYVVIFKFDTYEHLASWQESVSCTSAFIGIITTTCCIPYIM